MISKLSILVLVSLMIQPSYQDVYLHNPRGSNNRLNEANNGRTNGNRVFDSQNNNQGGYNVGDATSAAFANEDQQYQMKYFAGSLLNVEYTAQHGCGVKNNLVNTECNIVLQYMCQPDSEFGQNNLDRIRDGLNTNNQDYTQLGDTDTEAENANRKAQSVKLDRVLQETWESYDACYLRERNRGLFVADRNLNNNNKGYSSASFTRQNNGGTRYSYECAEERDYYPYWHPSAWKDIAVLATDTSKCAMYQSESFNVKPRHKCVEVYAGTSVQKHWSRYNNKGDCEKNNGVWTEFYNYLEKATQFTSQETCEANKGYKWAIPHDSKNTAVKECLVLLLPPVCQAADFSRFNHLGNTQDTKSAQYQWKLPSFPSKKLQKCAFRLRYNISNLDYDQYTIDSNKNGGNSPIRNNPQVAVGPVTLQLAINTAQTGRTFQDRSHSFYILARPSSIPEETTIYNLNVRGKRGNIVQVYPGVEYDFIPNDLRLKPNELVHIQWTGSNSNPNGNAGQGQAGTDRSNLVLVKDLNTLYPIQFTDSSFIKDVEVLGYLNKDKLTDDSSKYLIKTGFSVDFLAVYLSSSAYYECLLASTCTINPETGTKVDANLNTAPASVPGALIKFVRANSTYYYMSSRNNAFSNRDQKGHITTI